jgi:hypothetical protein
MAFIASRRDWREQKAHRPISNMSRFGQASRAILRENEGVGPRQGNNAAQLSQTVPMTDGTAEVKHFTRPGCAPLRNGGNRPSRHPRLPAKNRQAPDGDIIPVI